MGGMRIHTSNIVTFQDLKAYFQGDRNNGSDKPDRWRSEINSDGEFWAYSNAITFNAFPEGVTYKVKVFAKEDPADSDETVTDKPAKFIADFLSTGGAGDEFFSKRSSSPDELAHQLRILSSNIEADIIGPRQTARILRRMVAENKSKIESPSVDTYDVQMESIEKLKSELSDKGWQVESSVDNRKLPVLTVTIGDEYEASISVDSIKWTAGVLVKSKDGDVLKPDPIETDDPIKSYQKLRKSEQVRKFMGDNEEIDTEGATEYDMGHGKTQAPDSGDVKTVAPKSKPKEEVQTVRPTKPSQE